MKQEQFLKVIPKEEAQQRFFSNLNLIPLGMETVALSNGLNRVLAMEIISPVDLPGFDRSNVDGFALRAEDTFGITESHFLKLQIQAGDWSIGKIPTGEIGTHQCAPMPTGGAIPRGANAVVMVENTEVVNSTLILKKPLVPGENISQTGSDISRGEVVLHACQIITSREIGVIAALGIEKVEVYKQPRVAIFSTGNELVPPGAPLNPGQIHDCNGPLIAAAVSELGCIPDYRGILKDETNQIRLAITDALAFDIILLSGGTSKGPADVTYQILNTLGLPGILVHGVAMKPGKPLCLAVFNLPEKDQSKGQFRKVPIAVLPGFPVSAIMTFHEFIGPVLQAYSGRPGADSQFVDCAVSIKIQSVKGRSDFLPVKLAKIQTPNSGNQEDKPNYLAIPVGKGSGSITSFSHADGFIEIPRQQEFLVPEENVQVKLFTSEENLTKWQIMGSHCPGVDFLISQIRKKGLNARFTPLGSQGGINALRRGECEVACIHLFDPKSAEYNTPFLKNGEILIPGYKRVQGLVFRKSDDWVPNQLTKQNFLEQVFNLPNLLLANRNGGSGTRFLIESILNGKKPNGFYNEFKSHHAVVQAIAQGRADWGVAVEWPAREANLGFLPLKEENFDFVIQNENSHLPGTILLKELLKSPDFNSCLGKYRCISNRITH